MVREDHYIDWRKFPVCAKETIKTMGLGGKKVGYWAVVKALAEAYDCSTEAVRVKLQILLNQDPEISVVVRGKREWGGDFGYYQPLMFIEIGAPRAIAEKPVPLAVSETRPRPLRVIAEKPVQFSSAEEIRRFARDEARKRKVGRIVR